MYVLVALAPKPDTRWDFRSSKTIVKERMRSLTDRRETHRMDRVLVFLDSIASSDVTNSSVSVSMLGLLVVRIDSCFGGNVRHACQVVPDDKY